MQLSSIVVAAILSLCAADDIPSCGVGLDACPEEYPCCSLEGTCGNGYVCLGGCDPRYSNTPGSCMPMPICKSNTYDLSSTDSMLEYTSYRGDADANPFIYIGNVTESNGAVRAVMTKDSQATTIILNRYVWYGKVSLTMKASEGSGVISTFILLSDAKDEIDYEMVGSELTTAQTNYYYHGVLNYNNMDGVSVSNVNENSLTYTIDWQEDKIDWIINGNTMRTLKRDDTYNSTTGTYDFPQTPQRVEFGLWAAGDSPYQGTSEWAGGEVDWDSAGSDGYHVEVSNLVVECYDAPSGTNVTGDSAYVYLDSAALASNIAITGDSTILESLDGTGENPCGSQCNTTSADTSSGATLGGTVVSSSSVSDATLSGSSEASSTSDSSDSSSASASGSSSGSASASGSSSASSSGAKTASATASSKSSSTSASTNGAVVLGAAAVIAPLAFIL